MRESPAAAFIVRVVDAPLRGGAGGGASSADDDERAAEDATRLEIVLWSAGMRHATMLVPTLGEPLSSLPFASEVCAFVRSPFAM